MKKRRRKSDHCLNCGTNYETETNYCPNCGQENNHNVASFGTVIVDFFHNYFSFDSKFSNSLSPFFFRPGSLTKQFIDGKRASFVNPIRLYLIISLVFFFVFTIVSEDFIDNSIEEVNTIPQAIPDSTKAALNEELQTALNQIDVDTTSKKYVPEIPNFDYQVNQAESESEEVIERNIVKYMDLRKNLNLQPQQLLDSMDTTGLSTFQHSMMRQSIRLDRAGKEVVVGLILKNLPLMMLVLIPIFALTLKLLYIRGGHYYITHLVHALHLHSFAYVIYGLTFLVTMYWIPSEGPAFTIILLSWILVCTHSYFSFLKVYGQSWKRTFVKFNLIGMLYSTILSGGIVAELLLSILSY